MQSAITPNASIVGMKNSMRRYLSLDGVWQRFVSEKDTSLKPSRHGHFRDHFFNFLDIA